MLISNLIEIGDKLYSIRKSKGFTQAELAEKAELSDRTYADIERGNTNMRVETLIKICNALSITPDEILLENNEVLITENHLIDALKDCSNNQKETALNLLYVYINSLK